MTRYVSLFRGINVGGHHLVRMQDIKAMHESLGLQEVSTYLQSGNVVFTSHDAETADLLRLLEARFAHTFGFQANVLLRTAADIDALIALNPFPQQAIQAPQWLVVVFLASTPEPDALDELRQTYRGPEVWQLIGQELAISYPNGIGRSPLSAALLEKTLHTKGTARNWNTVLHLQQMLQS